MDPRQVHSPSQFLLLIEALRETCEPGDQLVVIPGPGRYSQVNGREQRSLVIARVRLRPRGN